MLRNNLKTVMEAKGITEAELSGLTDMTQESINRLKNTDRDPRVSTALRIARALKVPVEKLFSLSDRSAA